MTKLSIFSGGSNLPLATKICAHLNKTLGEIYHHTFPSGELYSQYKENIRGKDVFLIQGSGNGNTNDHFMQLLIMSDAARRASADRITAVMPMSFYQRQDRKEKSRVPISAKLALDLIQAAGIDRVVTMDLHSPQIGGFTNLPFDHLAFEPVLIEYIRSKHHGLDLRDNVIIMAPDVGAVKRAEKYADVLKCDFGFISKKRIGDEKVAIQSLNGDVKGKSVIIIDDMTESGGTLIQAADACKKNGATKVTCAVTHAAITETGMSRLASSMPTPGGISSTPCIDEFVHSNTVDLWWKQKYKPANIVELDVSSLLAKAIQNIHNNESVSELFM